MTEAGVRLPHSTSRRSRRGVWIGYFAPGLVTLLLAACSSAPALEHTHASPEALAARVLAAIASGDRATLDAAALTEQEFRDHVWPYLPAARPERNLPYSYVWGELRQKGAGALTETLARHRGRRYDVVAVRFDGVTDYGAYRVHRNASFAVRDAAGATHDIRVCGSLVEQGGRWKVFSYAIAD